MFDIYHALKHLYPTLEDEDVHLEQRDGAPRIARWNEAKLGTEPSIETLEAVKRADIDAAKKSVRVEKLSKKKEIAALINALSAALSLDAKDLSDAVAAEYDKL